MFLVLGGFLLEGDDLCSMSQEEMLLYIFLSPFHIPEDLGAILSEKGEKRCSTLSSVGYRHWDSGALIMNTGGYLLFLAFFFTQVTSMSKCISFLVLTWWFHGGIHLVVSSPRAFMLQKKLFPAPNSRLVPPLHTEPSAPRDPGGNFKLSLMVTQLTLQAQLIIPGLLKCWYDMELFSTFCVSVVFPRAEGLHRICDTGISSFHYIRLKMQR